MALLCLICLACTLLGTCLQFSKSLSPHRLSATEYSKPVKLAIRNSKSEGTLNSGKVLSTLTTEQSYNFTRAHVGVVVIVTSAAGWVDRRNRIRNQFPRNTVLIPDSQATSIVLKFAIGTEGVDEKMLRNVREEHSHFADVLFLACWDEDADLKHPHLWRLDGGSSSTTSKVMLSIRWAVRHYTFDYFFRLGDDSYFRIDKFVDMLSLHEIPIKNTVIGHIMSDTVFNMQQIYPQGMGYGLTQDLCHFIARNTAFLLDTAPEDCVVARWLFAVGARFINSPRWRDIHMGDKCHPHMVLAHKLPIESWARISPNGTVDC